MLRLMGDGSGDSDNLDLVVASGYASAVVGSLLAYLQGHSDLWDFCEPNTIPWDRHRPRCSWHRWSSASGSMHSLRRLVAKFPFPITGILISSSFLARCVKTLNTISAGLKRDRIFASIGAPIRMDCFSAFLHFSSCIRNDRL